MEIIDFGFFNYNEPYENKYSWWSRIYEYDYVIKTIDSLIKDKDILIHNTSWGYEGDHVIFKNTLDNIYKNSLHSDIKKSNINNTFIYDITKKIDDKYINYFDVVINISTIEEVPFDNIQIIKNLFEQVKVNGYLIITFDFDENTKNKNGNGSMNINEVLEFLKDAINYKDFSTISTNTNSLNGINSVKPNSRYVNLNCGKLILKKIIQTN